MAASWNNNRGTLSEKVPVDRKISGQSSRNQQQGTTMSNLIQTREVNGIVTAVSSDGIHAIPADACGMNDGGKNCSGGCGSCGGKKKVRTYTLVLRTPHDLHTGQQIRFRYHSLHETVGALIVFGIPLVMAFSTLLLWQVLQPQQAESGRALLSSGIALACGFGVVRIIDRFFGRTHPPELLSAPAPSPSPDGTTDA